MTNKTKTLMTNKTKTIAKKAPAKKVIKTRPSRKVTEVSTELDPEAMVLTVTLTVRMPMAATVAEAGKLATDLHLTMGKVLAPGIRARVRGMVPT